MQIRNQIIETIRLKKYVIVDKYDSEELEVLGQEVDEMIAMIQDKNLIMELLNQKKQVGKPTTILILVNILMLVDMGKNRKCYKSEIHKEIWLCKL